MQHLSARIRQLLRILLEESAPISVDKLATRLSTSRRSVFRDLEKLEEFLSAYLLRVDTRIGEGLTLEGKDERKKQLRKLLEQASVLSPRSKDERRIALALDLLNSSDWQKLYSFSSRLRVSEASISYDLDVLEPQFRQLKISLLRRPGQGVIALGDERAVRSALLFFFLQAKAEEGCSAQVLGFPDEEVERGVRVQGNKQLKISLDWMTDESRRMLLRFLMILITRIKNGHHLDERDLTVSGLPKRLADYIADGLEEEFSLSLAPVERSAIAESLCACRARQQNPLSFDDESVTERVRGLAYRMIERFDPELAPKLKMNEKFVQGLSLHLWSAVVRMEGEIFLSDPLEGQIEKDYPDLYGKSLAAAAVLQEEFGKAVPSSEVSFIATYFGAALEQLDESSTRKRQLVAGVVCVSGIGVSYLMSSQLRKRFKGELEVEICDWNDPASWRSADFLVSTIALDEADLPVVQVQTLLSAKDFAAVRKEIDTHAYVDFRLVLKAEKNDFCARLEELQITLTQIRELLEGFSRFLVSANADFVELTELAVRVSVPEGAQKHLQEQLLRREKLSTQVIAHLEILLMHSRSSYVEKAKLALLIPEGGQFNNEALVAVRSVLMMLIPEKNSKRLAEFMGQVSSALIEDEVFLRAVQCGDTDLVYRLLEMIAGDYLNQLWGELLQK